MLIVFHSTIGNCMLLNDGRLGLIDYGQCRRIDDQLRKKFSRVVVTLDEGRIYHPLHGNTEFDTTGVAQAMRQAGFALRNNSDDETLLQFGRILFDSDEESEKLGYASPQDYFHLLMERNPMTEFPESASKCVYRERAIIVNLLATTAVLATYRCFVLVDDVCCTT